MDAYEFAELQERRRVGNRAYLEFLHVPTMSAGIYELAAGATDLQQPHNEDEIYYVVRGRAQIRVDGEDRAVQAGSIIFVAAGVEHRFHSIEDDLSVLVLFAPAESGPE